MSITATDSNVYFVRKEMFISAESASKRIQLQLATPQLTHGGGSTPTKKAIRLRDAGVGLQLRGHTCGPDAVRSEMGFDVKVECFSLQIQQGKVRKRTKNKHPAWSARNHTTPVDPAGPHCYRDRTKTC
jgi:hypothetical protein